jgi:hypothetical protein
MPREKRTRVEIFLPMRSDLLGYQTALEWLAEELAYARGGSTLTTPFAGLFASATQVDIIHDAVRILFCDFELDCEKADDLADIEMFLENAKDFLMKALQEEEVWIVYHPITRIVS